MTKICSKCKAEKPFDDFYREATRKDGRKTVCKSCSDAGHSKYIENNREAIKESRRKYRQVNAQDIAAKLKEYRIKNADKLRENYKVYYWNNREKILSTHPSSNYTTRRENDPQFKIAGNLRNRLNNAIKISSKSGSAIRDLGCSIENLKEHLESKFQPGMTWDNYGKGIGKWQIDHIIPLSAFDLTDRQHIVLACNYLNLQPLWREDNLRKGANFPLENKPRESPLLWIGPSGLGGGTSQPVASPIFP